MSPGPNSCSVSRPHGLPTLRPAQGAYHGSAMPDFAIVENARKLGGSPGRALCVEHFPAALGDGRQATASPAGAARHRQPPYAADTIGADRMVRGPPQQSDLSCRDAKAQRQCTAERARVLAQAAAASTPGSEIIEIGTFDGRTTLNLAMNAPKGSAVFTLDLPPDHPTQFQLAPGERMFVEKMVPGERFRNGRRPATRKPPASCSCWGIPPRSTGRNISARPACFRRRLARQGLHAQGPDTARLERRWRRGLARLWRLEGVTLALEELDAERKPGLDMSAARAWSSGAPPARADMPACARTRSLRSTASRRIIGVHLRAILLLVPKMDDAGRKATILAGARPNAAGGSEDRSSRPPAAKARVEAVDIASRWRADRKIAGARAQHCPGRSLRSGPSGSRNTAASRLTPPQPAG